MKETESFVKRNQSISPCCNSELYWELNEVPEIKKLQSGKVAFRYFGNPRCISCHSLMKIISITKVNEDN